MASPYVVDYEELPPWSKPDPFILTGYRRPGDAYKPAHDTEERGASSSTRNNQELRARSTPGANAKTPPGLYYHDSFYKCWKSIWAYWHNETINIHSHLWGSMLALVLLALELADVHGLLPPGPWPVLSVNFPKTDPLARYPNLGLRLSRIQQLHPPSTADLVAMSVFLVAAMACLACSAIYHTVSCHSRVVAQSYNRLDYPILHFGFHCHPTLRTVYVAHALFWGILTFVMVTQPHFTSAKHKKLRTVMFVALGLSGVVPVLHGSYLARSSHFVFEVLGARYVVYSGASYIIGAMIYVAHVPERWWPRKFDYIGASHQLFHIFVLAGAWLHWLGVRQSYSFWHALETLSGQTGQAPVCEALHSAIAF